MISEKKAQRNVRLGLFAAASSLKKSGRMFEEPLFQNHDYALRFAYGKRSPIIDSVRYITDMIVKGGRGPATALGALSPEERIAQGAMILAFVGRMRDELQASIEARYTFGPQRSVAQEILTQAVLPHLTGISNRRMIYELVARHYGKRVHLGVQAKKYTVRRSVVTDKRVTVERVLNVIDERADGQVILYLQMSGLIA